MIIVYINYCLLTFTYTHALGTSSFPVSTSKMKVNLDYESCDFDLGNTRKTRELKTIGENSQNLQNGEMLKIIIIIIVIIMQVHFSRYDSSTDY